VLEEPRSPVDEEVLARSFEQTGAVVLGRRLFDVVDGPHGWDDGVGYGHDQDQSVAPPCYVVTHEKPAQVRLASRFRFVTGAWRPRSTRPGRPRATRTSWSALPAGLRVAPHRFAVDQASRGGAVTRTRTLFSGTHGHSHE
jgi:hypothetical protein